MSVQINNQVLLQEFGEVHINLTGPLLDDLSNAEKNGLPVKASGLLLKKCAEFVNSACFLPDGSSRKCPILSECMRLERQLREWVDISGSSREALQRRRAVLDELRNSSLMIDKKIRRTQDYVSKELIRYMVGGIYGILDIITKGAPNSFAMLAESLEYFKKTYLINKNDKGYK